MNLFSLDNKMIIKDTWERRGRSSRPSYFIMPVISTRPVVRSRAYRLAVSISKGDRFLSFTVPCGVYRGTATLVRSARQTGRWISMGYAKYFVFPITSTSLTHCTPGITIVYTTVHAIGLPGGWHRNLRRLRLSPARILLPIDSVASLFSNISFPRE